MSEVPTLIEVNCETGETIERPLTPEELEQQASDAAAAAEAEAARLAEEAAKEAAKQSALDKLTAMGLTEEEAQAIIGQ